MMQFGVFIRALMLKRSVCSHHGAVYSRIRVFYLPLFGFFPTQGCLRFAGRRPLRSAFARQLLASLLLLLLFVRLPLLPPSLSVVWRWLLRWSAHIPLVRPFLLLLLLGTVAAVSPPLVCGYSLFDYRYRSSCRRRAMIRTTR